MARQLENSLGGFASGQKTSAAPLLAGVVGVLLIVALGMALASEAWSMSAIIAVSLMCVGGLVYSAYSGMRRLRGRLAAGWLELESVLPEVQREDLRITVAELARILKPDADALSELQTAFIVAEDLAFRQVQHDEAVPVLRYVTVAGVPFSAIFTKADVLVCCETAFVVSPELRQDRVIAMMKKIAAVKRSIEAMNVPMRVRLMPVMITQMSHEDVAELRRSMSTARFSSTPTDIDLRLFDFDELQQTYINSSN